MEAASASQPSSPEDRLVDLWQPLRSIVGDQYVRLEKQAQAYQVEGVVPRAAVLPGSIEELSQVMAFAHRHRLITVPWGSGSQMHLGAPLSRIDLVCSLERLNRLIEYEPADMTLAVEAGMPLAQLQDILQEHGQFLPLDPPAGDTTTLGGCLSTRAAGPLRAGFGTLRDRLLGVRAVLPDGRIAKAGGRVVKNVAGYDMGRLYTGALGSLVIVVELYLKVQPLPAAWLALRVPFTDGPEGAPLVESALAALLDSEAEPAAVEVLDPALSGQLGWPALWHLVLAFAGTQAELAYVKDRAAVLLSAAVQEQLGGGSRPQPVEDVSWPQVHRQLLAAHRGDWPGSHREVTARAHLLSSQATDFMATLGETAAEEGVPAYSVAHGFDGIVRVHVGPAAQDKQEALLQRWREAAESRGGSLVLERAPRAIKERVGVWNRPDHAFGPESGFHLMEGIKSVFDPHRILNPGRFVGGL